MFIIVKYITEIKVLKRVFSLGLKTGVYGISLVIILSSDVHVIVFLTTKINFNKIENNFNFNFIQQ